MGAAVVIIVRKQREIVEGLRRRSRDDAPRWRVIRTSWASTSRTSFADSCVAPCFDRAGDGRYYLDEPSWVAHDRIRGVVSPSVMALAVLAPRHRPRNGCRPATLNIDSHE